MFARVRFSGTTTQGSFQTNMIPWPGGTADAWHNPTAPGQPSYWFGSLVADQRDASGLMYRRNRMYDPATGRFTQEDPIGIAGGLNTYMFGEGDPINYDDPDGFAPGCTTTTSKECPIPLAAIVVTAQRNDDRGEHIAHSAADLMEEYQRNHMIYRSPLEGPGTSDCSHFCSTALHRAGLRIPYHTTRELANRRCYSRVRPGSERAGDIVWQPGHMGIYAGRRDGRGRPLGYQMGNGGARLGPWGPGGWFHGGSQITYYRVNPSC